MTLRYEHGRMLLPEPEEHLTEEAATYLYHAKCGGLNSLTPAQLKLYRLGLFPMRCYKCGDLTEGSAHD